MSGSTTELGINVATGQSEENLNKLATGMENVLEKYVQMMEQSGRLEDAFKSISKAIGLHGAVIKEMASDASKAMAVLGPEAKKAQDMTIRGLSTNVTKQFNKLSADITKVFAQLPKELTASLAGVGEGVLKTTTNISKGLGYINNSIGGLRTELNDLIEVIGKVDTAAGKLKKNGADSVKDVKGDTTTTTGTPKRSYATAMRDAAAMDRAFMEYMNRRHDMAVIAETNLRRELEANADAFVKSVQENKRKEKEALEEAAKQSKIDTRNGLVEKFNSAAGVNVRTEDDTLNTINLLKKKAEEAGDVLRTKLSVKGYLDTNDIQEYQLHLTGVNKETKELALANRDMGGTASRAYAELTTNVGKLNAEFKAAKMSSKSNFLESMGISLPDLAQVQDGIRIIARELSAVDINKLPIADLEKYSMVLSQLKAQSGSVGGANEKAAVAELKQRVDLATKLRKEADERIALARKEKENSQAQAQIDAARERAVTDLKVSLIEANTKSAELSSRINKIVDGDTTPQFENMKALIEYHTELKETYLMLQKLAKQVQGTGDAELFKKWQDSLGEMSVGMSKFTRIMQGMNPEGMGGLKNTQAIVFEEQKDLLESILELTNKIALSRKKLTEASGNKGAIAAAAEELKQYEAQKQILTKKQHEFGKDMKNLGISGTHAMESINDAMKKLGSSFGSFSNQIGATASSFKDMWGEVTMAFGKFLLFRHTIGIVFGDIQNIFYAVKTALTEVMARTEVVTNLEKALRFMNETQGGLPKARQEMEYFKKTANDLGFAYRDLAEGFKQFKSIADQGGSSAAYSGVMDIWKKMTSAARATGQSGDLQDFFKGFTDAIGKGQIMTEELKKQLAQRIPGLIRGVEKEIAGFRGIDASKFNIFDAMEKGKVKLSEFMAAFQNYLPKWSALGETMGDAYSAAIGRLDNAWTDLLNKIATSDVGKNIITMIEKMTSDLKDDSIMTVVDSVVQSFLTLSRTLLRLAEYTIPQIGRAIRQIPIIGSDANIAAGSSQTVQNAAQSAVQQSSVWNLMYNSQQMGGFLTDMVSGGIVSPIRDLMGLRDIDPIATQLSEKISNRMVAAFESEDWGSLFADGWVYAAKDGTIQVAQTASEAAANEINSSILKTEAGLRDKVFNPMLSYLQDVDGDFSKVEKKVRQAQDARARLTGESTKLSIERMTQPEKQPHNLDELSGDSWDVPENFWEERDSLVKDITAVPNSYLKDYLTSTLKRFKESSVDLGNRTTTPITAMITSIFTDIDGGIIEHIRNTYADIKPTLDGFGLGSYLSEVSGPGVFSEYDRAASEEMAKKEKDKLDDILTAQKEKLLSYQSLVDSAEEDGSWASKIVKAQGKTQLTILKDRNDFKDKMDKVNSVSDPDEQKKIDDLKAQVTEAHNQSIRLAEEALAKQQTQIYTQAMRELESIDAEIASRISGGNLKNELKTQYEDLIKWKINTENKLEKGYSGLGGVDLTERYAAIQQAVERGSEQALRQGSTPAEIIEKAEKRALEGRVDAWESTYNELVTMSAKYNGLQIQAQFDLMTQEEVIHGKKKDAEKRRIIEAANENKKNFKNAELQDYLSAIQTTFIDLQNLQDKKGILGDLVDASGVEEAALSLEKLENQLKALGETSPETMKAYGRLQQTIIDKAVDTKISNAASFSEYLSLRFGKEQGLFDGPVAATQKQFEKMYEHMGSGAEELGQTLETAFTDAFTGTLKSWSDVWDQMKATFLKTLAAIIWEAKARPVVIGVASALTGISPAAASVGGSPAAKLAGLVSTSTEDGMFSKLSESVKDMTQSINDFGKDVLGMTSDLTDALVGAGFGVGIATVMFPENQLAKVGGAIGGAAGQVLGNSIVPGIGGAVGSAVGSVLGSFIGNAFGGSKKTTNWGIRVTVDEEGLQFLDKFERIKKSGGFGINLENGLASLTSSQMFMPVGWNHGSKNWKYSEVDPAIYKQISSAISTSFSTVSRQLLSLGLTPTFQGFKMDEMVSLKGEKPEELLNAWLEKMTGTMAEAALGNNSVLASFTAAKKSGETSAEALERLVSAMDSLQEGAISANVSIDALAGGLKGLDLASYASDLSDALGGSSGVSAFFNRIEKFIGYAGTVGIANIGMFEDKMTSAIGNINSFADNSGTRSSILAGQRNELLTSKDYLEGKLSNFAAGAGWKQWLTFDGTNLTMKPGAKYSTVQEMAAADPKWKAVLDPMIAYVEELKNTNEALESVSTKMAREGNLPASVGINATSATFWGDYQKALSAPGGLTPELAAAWDAAALVAESLSEMRESAEGARKTLEETAVAYNTQRETLKKSATLFTASSSALEALSWEAQQLNQSDLDSWFASVGNTIAEGIVPGLKDFIRTGETALDTLVRLTTALDATDQSAQLIGTSVQSLSGGKTGLGAASYSQGLIDYFGSQEIVSGILENIGDAIYTDDESTNIAKEYWRKQALAQAQALNAGDSIDAIKDWLKNRIAAGNISSAELTSMNALSTSINNLESASSSAADSVESLADYLQDITEKIAKLGMTDTESFLFDLNKEVLEMRDKIKELGGTDTDALLAEQYRVASISQRLGDMMDETYKSIRKLTSSDLLEQINSLSDSYWEQHQAAVLLGASQEQLNSILYNAYLQAKQVLTSAAQAYIQAYDDTVSQIEELKNKQQALEDGVAEARNDYMESLQKEIDLKQEAIDKLQENVDALTDFIGNLKDLKDELLVSAGFLSPTEQANITMSQFSQTAIKAAAGDETARGNVSSQAKAALDASASGSYADYIKSFATIYSTVSGLQDTAQGQLDPQLEQLNELKASRDDLQKIYDQLKEEADTRKSIADAQDAYNKAQLALSNSTYQAQIDALQASVDQHTTVVEELRKQYNTTADLATASKEYYNIKGILEKAVPDVSVLTAGMAPIPAAVEKQNTISEAIQQYQVQIAEDTKLGTKTLEKVHLLLQEINDAVEPVETTDKTDKGIKVIVAAASVRDGVLQALRSANDLGTVPSTSVVGLLNGIKTGVTPERNEDY